MRIAVVDKERCKPEKCNFECGRACPVNRKGEECIVLKEKAVIDEELCIGCKLCVKACPFGAISIVKTPEQLKEKPIHRFGENGFLLYRLPLPEKGVVVGLLGPNGVGKSTSLRILSGEMKPNLGEPGKEASPEELSHHFRGSELQRYFHEMEEKRSVYKPQSVEMIPRIFRGTVRELLERVDERGVMGGIVKRLGIEHTLERDVGKLSGGELQRVAVTATLSRDADMYYIDEPSSYLDVSQRIEMGKLIREVSEERCVMVVDHDLATLDFLADRIHIFYGVPGVYGVVSKPYAVGAGINTFLDGYIKEDNVRIRPEPIRFEVLAPTDERSLQRFLGFTEMEKRLDGFELVVEEGEIISGEILGVFGANALGKTTFARILAGLVKPDKGGVEREVKISYKPQYIESSFEGTVLELLGTVVKNPYSTDYMHTIIRPLQLERLLENRVRNLSGGELQRVAIALCLSREADLYLLDEPSAHLDVEQRLEVAKTIQRVVSQRETQALVIDHDILFLDHISNRGMVFVGKPGRRGRALSPRELEKSFNIFLKDVNITFRRDPQSGRPRANKPGSVKDREQKEKGEYYYVTSS